jgi:ribosomal protein S18 acetylase RimI-like enzyme
MSLSAAFVGCSLLSYSLVTHLYHYLPPTVEAPIVFRLVCTAMTKMLNPDSSQAGQRPDFKLAIRTASLADARAVASVFVAVFQRDVMAQWVSHTFTYSYCLDGETCRVHANIFHKQLYRWPADDPARREEITKLAIKKRESEMKRALCDPAIHVNLVYDELNKHKLIGLSGWKVVKPKSSDSSVSGLVRAYEQRMRHLSFWERCAGRIFKIYDNLVSTLLPDSIFEFFNPAMAEIAARRQRWIQDGRDEMKKNVRGEDVERGYYILTSIGVLAEYERKGIGSTLIERGMEQADEDDVAFYVAASGPGAGLYSKHGFDYLSRRVCFEGEAFGGFETVVMRRERRSGRKKIE